MTEYVYPSPVIAERIQKVFWDNDLTDPYVAKQIGCERKCIGAYRRAESNPSIKFIRWLCENYKIDVRWLLDLKGE